jgi:hypothetical protein
MNAGLYSYTVTTKIGAIGLMTWGLQHDHDFANHIFKQVQEKFTEAEAVEIIKEVSYRLTGKA